MGLGSNVMMKTLFLLSFLAFHSVSSSSSGFCHVDEYHESSIILEDSEHFLVHTPHISLDFDVVSETCGLNENINLDLASMVHKHEHSHIKDINGMEWYEMSYSLKFDSMLHVNVEAIPPFVYKRKVSPTIGRCRLLYSSKTFNVTFKGPVKIAMRCGLQTNFSPLMLAPGEVRYGDNSNYKKPTYPKDLMDLFNTDSNNYNGFFSDGLNANDFSDGSFHDDGFNANDFHDDVSDYRESVLRDLGPFNDINDNKVTLPPYNFNRPIPTYNTPSYRYYGGHIIFLPIGAIIFLLSVGLRCCLCRRKKVVAQRVRTITVVRRIPLSPSSQEFISANEPTPANPLDLPPAYADIENELPPPAYSELDTVHKMAPNIVGPAGEESAHNTDTSTSNVSADTLTESSTTSTNTVPSAESSTASTSTVPSAESVTEAVDMTAAEAVNGDLSGGESRSTLSRVLSVGSRTLKSQFSFKPMKEEEE